MQPSPSAADNGGRPLRPTTSFARFSQAAPAADAAEQDAFSPRGGALSPPPAAAAQPLPHGVSFNPAPSDHPVGIDPEEALPASILWPAAEEDDGFLADRELVGSILRSRSIPADASGSGLSNSSVFAELGGPLSRAPSGVPLLRRSDTSLMGADGAAYAAIDMPPLLSRHPSVAGGAAAAAAAAAADDGDDEPPSPRSAGGSSKTACFGRIRPSVGIALSFLCIIAAVSSSCFMNCCI